MRCALPMLLCSLAIAPLASQVPAAEYAARRDSLAAAMSEGVLIAIGGHEPAEDFLSFYPAPSFYYLTGVTEPDAVLLMVKRRGRDLGNVVRAAARPRARGLDGHATGRRGDDAGDGHSLAHAGRARRHARLAARRAGTLQVVGDLSGDGYATRDQQFVDALHWDHPNLRIVNANELVANLRMRHSAAELALERKAIDITVRAERDAISAIHPGVNEFEIQALIDYTFRRNGADRPSFSSIVGLGAQLHRVALQRE